MVTPVNRSILSFLFFFIANLAYAQPHINAPFYIDEYNKVGQRLDVYSFLDQAIPQGQNGCTPVWDFFFFRVRATGEIDSLYHNGNLPKEVTSKIITNIYATEGHWKIKKGVGKSEFCWFIFPYFDYGDNPYQKNDCTETDKEKQKSLMDMAVKIVILSNLLKDRKAILLAPSENGGGIIKL